MVEELAPVPEWLKGAVQAESTCWSAREGFKKCDGDEAPWGWDELDKANNADDAVLCPGCADAFLTNAGDFSNGVRVREWDWEYFHDQGTQHLTPLAERSPRFGEPCDACASISWVTVFVPELGGWVSFDGDMSPNSKVWLAHASELSPRVLEVVRDHGIEWEESTSESTDEGPQIARFM